MPIWHIDHLKTPRGNVDIGLIRDETKELAPRRGPHPEVLPLGGNLAETVVHARTSRQVTLVPIDTMLVDSIPGSSIAPSSYRLAPSLALFPLARVQKLKA